jgi:MFS family permease
MFGMALVTIGSLLFALAPEHASYAANLVPALLLLGLGMGIGFPATSITAMSSVREEVAGLASGIASTAHELGGAVGVAVLAAIAAGSPTVAAGHQSAFAAAAVAGAALIVLASSVVPSVRPAPGTMAAIH